MVFFQRLERSCARRTIGRPLAIVLISRKIRENDSMKWKFAGTEENGWMSPTDRPKIKLPRRFCWLPTTTTATTRRRLFEPRKAKRKLSASKWGKEKKKSGSSGHFLDKKSRKMDACSESAASSTVQQTKASAGNNKTFGGRAADRGNVFLFSQRFFFLKGLAFVLWPPPPQNKRCCFIRAEGNHFTLSFSHLSVVSRFLLPFRRLSASWNKRLAPTMEAHHHGPTQATCCTSVNRNDGRKKRHTLARWLAGATYHQPATPFLPKKKKNKRKEQRLIRTCNFTELCQAPEAGHHFHTAPYFVQYFTLTSASPSLRGSVHFSLFLSLRVFGATSFYCFASIVLDRTGDGFCLGHWSVTLGDFDESTPIRRGRDRFSPFIPLPCCHQT